MRRSSACETRRVPTVLLRHRLAGDCHHDWMLADPFDPEGDLWTGRVRPHSHRWASMRGWYVQQITPHRRAYLTYEGPVGRERGTVTRVDDGTFVALQWQHDRIVMDLAMIYCHARVILRRIRGDRWWAKVINAAPDATSHGGRGYD